MFGCCSSLGRLGKLIYRQLGEPRRLSFFDFAQDDACHLTSAALQFADTPVKMTLRLCRENSRQNSRQHNSENSRENSRPTR